MLLVDVPPAVMRRREQSCPSSRWRGGGRWPVPDCLASLAVSLLGCLSHAFICHHLCSGSLFCSESWKMTLSLTSHSCQSLGVPTAFLPCIPSPHPTSHRLLSISYLSLELCLICHILYEAIPDLCPS